LERGRDKIEEEFNKVGDKGETIRDKGTYIFEEGKEGLKDKWEEGKERL